MCNKTLFSVLYSLLLQSTMDEDNLCKQRSGFLVLLQMKSEICGKIFPHFSCEPVHLSVPLSPFEFISKDGTNTN